AAALGQIAEAAQLLDDDAVIGDGRGPDIGAQQHGVHAEPGHEVELLLCTDEVLLELVLRDSLEVAEGLVQVEAEAEPVRQSGDRLRGVGETRRSCSKISTPSNPARAAAWSFSSSVPDRHTVAIEVLIVIFPRGRRRSLPGSAPSSPWPSSRPARRRRRLPP